MSPLAQRVAAATNVDVNAVQGTGPKNRVMKRDIESAVAQPVGKVRATPAARHLADTNGVDLKSVSGSGPRGRIQSADVQAAISFAQINNVEVEAVPKTVVQSQSAAPLAVELTEGDQAGRHAADDCNPFAKELPNCTPYFL